MKIEIQKAILRACARCIRSSLEPLEKRLVAMETKDIQIDLTGVAKELLSAEELATLVDLHVATAVSKHFEGNPIQHGEKGDPGQPGEPGQKGEPGADGVGLAGAMIDRDGQLVVTKTNGESIPLGKVVGKDGNPGKDGADFTDTEFDYDGERGLIIRGKDGEIVKKMPIPLSRGYWREGMKAEKADVVTHDGNAWIALKDNASKPCRENDTDWQLFARRGRDGIQGPAGKAFKEPEPVRLTNG